MFDILVIVPPVAVAVLDCLQAAHVLVLPPVGVDGERVVVVLVVVGALLLGHAARHAAAAAATDHRSASSHRNRSVCNKIIDGNHQMDL